MKTLTAEQIAKRDARRARFKALWKQVADMPELERIQLSNKLGIVTVEGRQLSLNNQCLLALQCPGASVVGGFRQWIAQGRAVMKGQHGHMIWCPTGKPKQGEATEPTAAEVEGSELRFIIGTVFDISQTQEIETGRVNVLELEAA
jgi:hypothetical protein